MDSARKAVEGVILGKLPADDVDVARRIALKGVVANPRLCDGKLLIQAFLLLDT